MALQPSAKPALFAGLFFAARLAFIELANPIHAGFGELGTLGTAVADLLADLLKGFLCIAPVCTITNTVLVSELLSCYTHCKK